MSVTYPKVKHLKIISLRHALALLTNTRLGWKGLRGTNTLAYYKHSKLTAVKSYISLGLVHEFTAIRLVKSAKTVKIVNKTMKSFKKL